MILKCRINGKEYPLVQGLTIAERYNETLDSASIIISGVPKIDMLPYDDVFIYEGEFLGYGDNVDYGDRFYHHFLIDQFSEVRKNFVENIYEYTIELFSETKKLETIQLPNTSITQPLKIANKRSVWDYLKQYVEMYSPLYKQAVDGEENELKGTYRFNETLTLYSNDKNGKSLKGEFRVATYNATTFIPYSLIDLGAGWEPSTINAMIFIDGNDFGYSYANGEWYGEELKTLEILTNDVQFYNGEALAPNQEQEKANFIKWLKANATKTNNTWEFKKKYKLDRNLEKIFSKVYCPDFTLNAPSLKDVLTQLMLVKDMIPYVKDDVIYGMDITERKGEFILDEHYISNIIGSMSSDNYANNLRRNYSNALSQQKSARRVEYLGFRNSDEALMTLDNMRLETQFPIYKINKVYLCYYKFGEVYNDTGGTGEYKAFLCKQDITKLVLLNSTRNLLSQDWNEFNPDAPVGENTIDELAKYKLCTVGYDIGSKYITGWGTKYSYPQGWWQKERTYIQNIVEILDKNNPYGIYNAGYIASNSVLLKNEYLRLSPYFDANFINPFEDSNNLALGMKAFNFIVDYEAFYNGAVVHSKDEDVRDDITINDNSSSSLTLLEKDGLFQKEKLNRFGNKAIQINATYDTIDQMQPLGSVYDDDVIIYQREYSISDNAINVVYYGTKDYVLKNYFVSVYAKHRTYNLMSYGESVNRAENRKMYLMLSKDKSYFERENKRFSINKIPPYTTTLKILLSAFTPSERAKNKNYFETPYKINAGFITYGNDKYYADVNGFVSGNSLCFNLKMYDNVSAGVYVKDKEPSVSIDVSKDFTGSVQDWYLLANRETGFAEKLGFYVAHIDNTSMAMDKIRDFTRTEIMEDSYRHLYDNTLFKMPKISELSYYDTACEIGDEIIVNKDNKETIDMTYQIEPITNDKNVLFSQWLMKLCDLLSTYNKVVKEYNVNDTGKFDKTININYVSAEDNTTNTKTPLILIEMNIEDYNSIIGKDNIASSQAFIEFGIRDSKFAEKGLIDYYSVLIKGIKDIREDAMVVNTDQVIKVEDGYGELIGYGNSNTEMTFRKITSFGNNAVPSGKIWLSNAQYISGLKPSCRLFPENELSYKDGTLTIVPEFKKYNFKTSQVMPIDALIGGYATIEEMYFSSGIKTTYLKNMVVVASDKPLKKTLVYDEFAEDNLLGILSDVNVSDVFYLDNTTNKAPAINVNLKNIPNGTKSIQYWYFDEDSQSYKFVFGVNVSEKDKDFVKIYLSLISTRDTRVYDENHNVVGDIHNYLNDSEYYGVAQFYDKK